jgi:hypothetical protein
MKLEPLIVASLLLIFVGCGAGPQNAAPTTASTATVLSGRSRDERAAATIDRVASKDFAGAREWFDATMLDRLPADRIGAVWSQLEGQLGAFKARSVSEERLIHGYPAITYDVAFERGHVTAQVVYDEESRVAGLFFRPVDRLH